MNRSADISTRNQLGKIVELPKDLFGLYLYIKVQIDLTKPLKRIVNLVFSSTRETKSMSLKYEKLPDFYYACGIKLKTSSQ